MTKTRSTATGDRCRVHTVLCAGLLLVFMAGHPALAQPGTELEIGGGYHAALDLGSNFFTVPSTATVDVRATNWVSDRWGVAARALVGLGGYLRSPAGVERRHPTYFQMLVRYRGRRLGAERSARRVRRRADGVQRARPLRLLRLPPPGPGGARLARPDGPAQHPVRRQPSRTLARAPARPAGMAALRRSKGPPRAPPGRADELARECSLAPKKGSTRCGRAAVPPRVATASSVQVPDKIAAWDDNGNGRISCAEARAHGIAPVRRNHPAYSCRRERRLQRGRVARTNITPDWGRL